jgi:hypothetical protein
MVISEKNQLTNWKYPINNVVEKEWQNLKTVIHNAACESLGRFKKHTPKKETI